MIYIKDTTYKFNRDQNYMYAIFKCNACGDEKEYPKTKMRNKENSLCRKCTDKAHGDKVKTHGDSQKNALYYVYRNMKARCCNKKIPNYHRYGGRGITVCDEWLSSYNNFKEWSLNNGYIYIGKSKGEAMSIDRIDVNGNYEPSNCQFIKNSINSSKDCIMFSKCDSIAIKSIKNYFGFSNSKIGKIFNCGQTLISNTINDKIKFKETK